MEFPHDPAVMLLLLAIHTGQALDAADGEMTLEVPGVAGPVAVAKLHESLDALEDRGWVEFVAGRPATTEQGRYAIERYFRKNLGRNVRIHNLALRAVRV